VLSSSIGPTYRFFASQETARARTDQLRRSHRGRRPSSSSSWEIAAFVIFSLFIVFVFFRTAEMRNVKSRFLQATTTGSFCTGSSEADASSWCLKKLIASCTCRSQQNVRSVSRRLTCQPRIERASNECLRTQQSVTMLMYVLAVGKKYQYLQGVGPTFASYSIFWYFMNTTRQK